MRYLMLGVVLLLAACSADLMPTPPVADSKVTDGPFAKFDCYPTGNPLEIQFIDRSTQKGKITERRWIFGDGHDTDWGAAVPAEIAHVYSAPGVYPGSLYVRDADGNAIGQQRWVYVEVTPPPQPNGHPSPTGCPF